MKYLLTTLEYPPFKGGVSHYYKNLIENWPEKNIRVLTSVKEARGGKVIKKSLTSKIIYPHWLPALFYLARALKKFKINYVLVGQILPLGIPALWLSRIFKFKYALILHGMDLTLAFKKRKKKWISKKIIKRADKIICGNSYVKEILLKQMGEDIKTKIKIINPALNREIPEIDPQLKKKIEQKYDLKGEAVILSLGRLVRRKGFDKVLESLPEISQKKDVKYFLAGIGPDKERLEKIKKNLPPEVKKNVFLPGNISEEGKWALLSLSDVFVMPARQIGEDFEGFGIVFLEANLLKKAVIGGRSGGIKDAIIHGETGLLVNGENKQEIKGAIIKLLENEALRKKMGEQGRTRVLKKFNWPAKAREIYNFLNY